MKTHLSCEAVINLGDIRLNRCRSLVLPPKSGQRFSLSPSWRVPIAQFHIHETGREEVCLHRHRAMPLTATPGGESREKSPGAQKGDGVCRSITGHDCVTITPVQATKPSKWTLCSNRKRLICSLRAITSVFNKSWVIIIYQLQSKSWSWTFEMTQPFLLWLSSVNQSASPQAERSSTFLGKMNL